MNGDALKIWIILPKESYLCCSFLHVQCL